MIKCTPLLEVSLQLCNVNTEYDGFAYSTMKMVKVRIKIQFNRDGVIEKKYLKLSVIIYIFSK